jgi:murein DD-endopeptidase MepM/ murein hydrolase activator NlpD
VIVEDGSSILKAMSGVAVLQGSLSEGKIKPACRTGRAKVRAVRRFGVALVAAALAACVRHAPPAPVVEGQSAPPPMISEPPVGEPPPETLPADPRTPVLVAALGAPPPASTGSPVIRVDASIAPRPAARPSRVTVQPGETLYAISRRYDVPVRALIDANRLAPPYTLAAGQTLDIPQLRQHVVQAGETLYSVSRLFGVDTDTLARANDIAPPYRVVVGQALVVPATVAPSGAVAPRPRVPAEIEPAAVPPPHATPPALPPPREVEPAAPPSRAAGPASPPLPRQASPPLPPESLAALPPPATLPHGSHSFLWPVHGRLISGYGDGDNGTRNDGVNIAAPPGTPVIAAESGVVAYVGNELRGYGNLVLIKHAGGWMTAYAHNAKLLVKRGDHVKRGQPIALVGRTGGVSEPQLHFEIRRGRQALDPGEYLPNARATMVDG